MKSFNLDAALKGEPVMLRSGEKAFVLGKCNKPMCTDEALIGYYVSTSGHECAMTWMITGQIDGEDEQIGDIIGMWEETIRIGNIDVPGPERSPLKYGESYYIPTTYHNIYAIWQAWGDDPCDFRCLERGLVHKTREAAEKHAKALIALTQKDVSCTDQC